jgi:hypothetical protein
VGWKVRKYPAVGEAFFLTSPFIELSSLQAVSADEVANEERSSGKD